jgi:predicted RNA-binding Zn ribbon-like protein
VVEVTFEQPAGREPAPGRLALLQAFVNTYWNRLDGSGGVEHLVSPADLRSFLAEHDALAPPARVTRAELEQARAVREALRQLAAHNNGAPLPPDALPTLDAVADAAGLTLRVGPGRPVVAATQAGVTGALGRLLAIVAVSTLDGSWPRVKACAHPNCGYVFFDRSNNRSSRWCSMAVCGSRVKMSAHRRRRAAAPPA